MSAETPPTALPAMLREAMQAGPAAPSTENEDINLPKILQQIDHMNNERKRIVPTILSVKEEEVLDLVGEGKSDPEIAELLGKSDLTIKNRLTQIRDKFIDEGLLGKSDLEPGFRGARGTSATVAVIAAELGWIKPVGPKIQFIQNRISDRSQR